jgi:hypothetical protein
MTKFLTFAFVVLVFIGCSKNDSTPVNKAPVVTLTSPKNNEVFDPGQPIVISATITDDGDLGEIHIHVHNADTNAELIHEHEMPTTQTFTLNKSFVAEAGLKYAIEIEADDLAGHVTTVDVTVSVK